MVESLFYDYALKIIGNSLYAGVLMGLIMAVIFTFLVYLFCIKRYNCRGKILEFGSFHGKIYCGHL